MDDFSVWFFLALAVVVGLLRLLMLTPPWNFLAVVARALIHLTYENRLLPGDSMGLRTLRAAHHFLEPGWAPSFELGCPPLSQQARVEL